MKTCSGCQKSKPLDDFHKNKAREDGVSVYCIICSKDYYEKNKEVRLNSKRNGYKNNPEKYRIRSRKNYRSSIEERMLYSAKRRAKLNNLPFNLTLEDIVIPLRCPVLGIDLKVNNDKSQFDSPSLDKINPKKGYVKENIIVVSMKANQIKTNATMAELEAVCAFYRGKLT